MATIPPQERNAFQAAVACDMKAASNEPLKVTPEYVRQVRDRIRKSRGTIVKCRGSR